MTVRELLSESARLGIQLAAQDGRLRYTAPKGTLTAEFRDALARHKPELLAWLVPVQTYVTLKDGPTLPVAPIMLAIDLEARGIPLRTEADHQFMVPDDPRLTPTDRAAIGRWRHHLGAIVEYRAPEIA
jgi:hypothetical protein